MIGNSGRRRASDANELYWSVFTNYRTAWGLAADGGFASCRTVRDAQTQALQAGV